MQTQETATPTPRKPRLPYIAGGIIVVLLLIAAAFVGGRLLRGEGLSGLRSGGSGGGPMLGGPGGNSPVSIDMIPAKELPQITADVSGLFDHRQDNSIFVGTGEVRMNGHTDQSGNVQASSSHSGPVVEVVVTTQTVIYRDVTMKQFNDPPTQGQNIQQVVEAGSLDEVGQNSMIMVWGRKTGDRFIADVLLYSLPQSGAPSK
jgi:hypothetical protein